MEVARERRQFGRRTTYTMAWIIVQGRPRLSCRIANISPKGAMLEFAVPKWLPFSFKLMIEGRSELVDCEIRHVGQHGIGVNFCELQSDHETPISVPNVEQQLQWIGLKPANTRLRRAPGESER